MPFAVLTVTQLNNVCDCPIEVNCVTAVSTYSFDGGVLCLLVFVMSHSVVPYPIDYAGYV